MSRGRGVCELRSALRYIRHHDEICAAIDTCLGVHFGLPYAVREYGALRCAYQMHAFTFSTCWMDEVAREGRTSWDTNCFEPASASSTELFFVYNYLFRRRLSIE